MTPSRRAVVIACGAAVFAASSDGPDFGHYIDWAVAALDHNIFALRGDILSPAGVPYSLWSFEPGVLFALTERATGGVLTLTEAAYLTGWLAAIALWVAAAFAVSAAVRAETDSLAPTLRVREPAVDGSAGRRALAPPADRERPDADATTMVVLAAMFVGTHAGLYSHVYATEVFGMSLVASVWALGYCRQPWTAFDAAAAGILTGLLFLVRPYLVVYAIGPIALGTRLDPKRLLAAGVPLIVAAAQYLVVNRWMTGSPWQPPYLFGDDAFRSVDLMHPELRAVLVHPWHGLLAYH